MMKIKATTNDHDDDDENYYEDDIDQGWELQIEKTAEICRGPGAA
jgi:hypothetical protein